MLIACPTCTTTYHIELPALGPTGRTVRCAQCRETWFATPAEALATTAVNTSDQALLDKPPSPTGNLPVPASVFASIPPETDITPVERASIALAHAPPLVPDDAPAAEAAPIEAVPDAIETIAARRARRAGTERKPQRNPLSRLASAPVAIVVLLVMIGAILNWRGTIVRHLPQTGSLFAAIGMPVNLRGLVFQDVKSTTDMQDGVPVLVVEGTVVNLTTRTQDVPRLRFALRNAAGHEVYAWTSQPGRPTLASGTGLAFRTRLASPPPDGRDVIVRFFHRRDMTAGLQ